MADRERVYDAEAMVLRRRNVGEADSIFTMFSPTRGRFDCVARGVRKPRSRMRGHLEPLTRTRLLLARGRTLDVVTQAEAIESFHALREDLERTAAALYCLDLVVEFGIEAHGQEETYRLLLEVVGALDAGAPLHLVRAFELQLLTLSGYDLQLGACASCGNRLTEQDTFLSPAAGGFACTGCRGSAEAGRLLSLRAAKVLRFLQRATVAEAAALRVDEVLGEELQLVLGEVVRFTLEREVPAARYVEAVSRLPGR